MSDIFGFLNIDKPSGVTSHDVVSKIRRELKIKKVGHTGTLDPLATGVLVICLGSATRLSDYVMKSSKTYQATIQLGTVTATFDSEGEILHKVDSSHIRHEDVSQVLTEFIGDIEQIPPMYSAIKHGGRKLYELARESKTVERKPRHVTIESLEIIDWKPTLFVLDVVCSSGTYVRSLANDIGERLGVGAHLAGLIRTQNGAFSLAEAVQLNSVVESEKWQDFIIPVSKALSNIMSIQMNETQVEHIRHGRRINVENNNISKLSLVRVHNTNGEFVALLRRINETVWQPHKVFLK